VYAEFELLTRFFVTGFGGQRQQLFDVGCFTQDRRNCGVRFRADLEVVPFVSNRALIKYVAAFPDMDCDSSQSSST
jgi:hypothetical protein